MTPKISYPAEGNSLCYQLESDSYWFTHRNNCIISVVKRFSKKDTFIDIGGGNGFVSLGLQNAGITSVLLEPNRTAIQNAKKRGLKKIICSTLEDAKFDAQSIRSAGIFDVLEHIEDDTKFLTKMNTILKKDGYLYITVPAFQFLRSDEDSFAGHFRRYTIHELRDKLNRAGFNIRYATYMFSILALPIFIFRSAPSLFRNRVQGDSMNYRNQHKPNNGFTAHVLDIFLSLELTRINKLNYIPFGSSCLIVAQKV